MTEIEFQSKTFGNGLRVIAHQHKNSAMASVNLLYRVGARNENPQHTGLAHLFEHLMFGGSARVPSFDEPLQRAAGENNAFTNNDYTNYYIALPAANIQTALFVESDRMESLNLTQQGLDVQKKVVVEEFAQRYTNQPYGDVWPLLRAMCYEPNHPYSWTTIGRSAEHITKTTLDDARDFYGKFYAPNNAILSIASPYDSDEIFDMAQKWFGHIAPCQNLPQPPHFGTIVHRAGSQSVERDVAASVIYICFAMGGRTSQQADVLDVVSDVLCSGESSRLVQRLVKGRALFSSVNCYITAEEGEGLLVVTGRLMDSTSMAEAEEALWRELRLICDEGVEAVELDKVRNKFEANNYFSQINSLNKAMNLGYYEFLGSADMINSVVATHASVGVEQIRAVCQELFTENHATILYYNKL